MWTNNFMGGKGISVKNSFINRSLVWYLKLVSKNQLNLIVGVQKNIKKNIKWTKAFPEKSRLLLAAGKADNGIRIYFLKIPNKVH